MIDGTTILALVVVGLAVYGMFLWRKRLLRNQYRRLDEVCRRDGVDLQ